jgi:hypothetical protein
LVGAVFVVVVVVVASDVSDGVGGSALITMVGFSTGITRGVSLAELGVLALSTTPRVRTITYAAMS